MTDTAVTEHEPFYETEGNSHRMACPCGYRATFWMPGPPRREAPVRCLEDKTVIALCTLQFSWGGLFDGRPADGYQVHLVRSTPNGTPGPSLCGIDRFAKDAPGWSVGGGVSGPSAEHKPCPGCADVAREQFPGLPVAGSVGGKEMAEFLGVDHERYR
jgi:hypothetical protein